MSATATMAMPARRLVLVADDEAAIQAVVTRVISGLGLVALAVGDGAAAIAAVEAHQGELICAILDVVMPVVNGVDAARAIQRIAPDMPIVLMSGAVPAHSADSITRLQLAGMLDKPFRLWALRELIVHAVEAGIVLEGEPV